jgi:predicted transcriptional regulator
MSRMKQIAMLVRDNEAHVLHRLIKTSEKADRNEVNFLGKSYSLNDARLILLYMYNEQAKQNKIRRIEKSLDESFESPRNSNS